VDEATIDSVRRELADDAASCAARHDPARHVLFGEPVERFRGAGDERRCPLLVEIAEPAPVGLAPKLFGKIHAAIRVLPGRRIRARVNLAIEMNAEVREHADVRAIGGFGGIDERAVPIEKDGTHVSLHQNRIRTPSCNWRG